MNEVRLPFNAGHNNGVLRVKCMPVRQPIGQFFIGSINSKDLVDITYSDVRRITSERGVETYLGIQRPLSPARVKTISSYARTADACFPTSVIISVDERCAEYDEDTGLLTLYPYTSSGVIEDGDEPEADIGYERIARVIDGQHRIAGLEGYSGDDFYINVSIFVGIDVALEGYIFSTVNLAQTKVNKSLVYDLFGLAEKRSPQKLCHNIAVALDSEESSPFFRKIKRLGRAESRNIPSSITQAAFVEALLKMLSRDPLVDRDLYMRGKRLQRAQGKDTERLVFRDFMIDERDFDLTDIVWNYFDAVRQRWPDAWNSDDQGVMLSKTNGFMALMRLLRKVYLSIGEDVPKTAHFLEYLQRVDFSDNHFSVDNYKPGSSGEGALFRDLVGKIF